MRNLLIRPQAKAADRLSLVHLVAVFFFGLCFGFSAHATAPKAKPKELKDESITQVRRFAVIVGANAGGPERAVLRYATQDALTLETVFSDIGGVDPRDRLRLQQPKPEALRRAFSQLSTLIQRQRAQPENRNKRFELLFYYSGHSDEQGLLIGEQKIAYRELKQWIAKVPTDIHVAILDSCASGAFTRLKGGSQRKPFLFANSGNVKGHAFIASSSADEASQESDRIAGSFFTHFLVSGLRGAADVDGDKLVTINEAFLFARNETLARTQSTQAGAQHPAYELKLAGTGDLVLTDLREAQTSLDLAGDLQGRIFVRDDHQRLVAELLKSKGHVLLALEAGSYEVFMDDGRTLKAATVVLPTNGQKALQGSDFTPVPRESISGIRGVKEIDVEAAKVGPFNKDDDDDFIKSTPKSGGARVVEHHFGHFAILPRWEFPTLSSGFARSANLSLSLLYGRMYHLKGIGLSLGVIRVDSQGSGLQAGMVGNIAHRYGMTGIQASFGFNKSAGQLRGAQLSFVTNIADRLHGAQLAMGLNFASYLRGAQVAMGMNVVKNIRGPQLSMGLNHAREVRGLQFSAINIATKVKGAQIGLINVADEADVSIGLIPYTKGGIHLEVFTSDLAAFNLGLRTDAKYNYSFLTLGIHPFRRGQAWMAGVGTGFKFPLTPRFTLSPDFAVRAALTGKLDLSPEQWEATMVITSLRLLANFQLLKRLALFAGPSVHLRYQQNPQLGSGIQRPGLPGPTQRIDSKNRIWVGFSAGIRI